MLKSISLKNYKCFKDETTIDIAPLTVLCGVNSSGKSSILKSLLMLKQSYENNPTKGQLVFSGSYVDNGTFKDVVYNNTDSFFNIKNSFNISKRTNVEINKDIFFADNSNYRELNRIFKLIRENLIKEVNNYKISVELEIMGNSTPKTQIQAIKNTISKYEIYIELRNKDEVLYVSDVIIEKDYTGLYIIKFVSFPLTNINEYTDGATITADITDCHCYYDGLKIIKIFSDNAPKEYDMNNFLPNLYTIFSIVSNQYYNIKHISPLRYFPNRSYTITRAIRDMSPSGEDMLQVLAQYGTSSINFLFMDKNNNWKRETDTLFIATQKWAAYLETGELNLIQNEETVKMTVHGHNLIDVGVGVGQSTPILIEGLFAPMGSTLMIEQPEIHLHPKAQMNMADFLLSLSLNHKNVIVETHSDHIINRLVKRIMLDKTGQLNKDICIYFIDKDNKHPVERIKITPTKGIVSAPINFFTQFASESMDIAKIGFTNHKEGVSWICNE